MSDRTTKVLRYKRRYMDSFSIFLLDIIPCTQVQHPPQTTNRRAKKNKNKSESRFQPIDRRTRPISGGGSNQREPLVLPGSPSPRASADTLFLLTSRAPEEQRQSCLSHSGKKVGGKGGIGGIGQYTSPPSALWCT
jgi:hypothetical protein